MTAPETDLNDSIAYLRAQLPYAPVLGIILGSGLGDFADGLADPIVIHTSGIPHYPVSTVPGHRGRLVLAKLHGIPLLVFQGRIHFFEAPNVETVVFPVRVAHRLGVKTLIVTNASGGVNRTFHPGDLMVLRDQINLTTEVLILPEVKRAHGSLFDKDLTTLVEGAAQRLGIVLKKGVYACVKGPSYETAAEVEMISRLGGDAVGMSTVLEVLLAHQLGMKVLGISCITNEATGISDRKLNHAEVTEVGERVKQSFGKLIEETVRLFGLGTVEET